VSHYYYYYYYYHHHHEDHKPPLSGISRGTLMAATAACSPKYRRKVKVMVAAALPVERGQYEFDDCEIKFGVDGSYQWCTLLGGWKGCMYGGKCITVGGGLTDECDAVVNFETR
jgi:hypothetical protein